MILPSEMAHERPVTGSRGLPAAMPWERPAPPPPPGPCTWCGTEAPLVLPAAARYDAPAVYACPAGDHKACDNRKRARDAEAAERAAQTATAAIAGSARARKGTARKRAPRPSQARKTLLGQAGTVT